MQAAEAALRQVGLHNSADDFQQLLLTYFAVQRRSGLLEGDQPPAARLQPESMPKRQPQRRAPRRIPGLGRRIN